MAKLVRIHKCSRQVATARLAAHDLARGLVIGMSGTALMLSVIALLYIAKSAAGINLMAGPSPLHDYLFHIVR